jgi:hemerythrin-like domain-containing protein
VKAIDIIRNEHRTLAAVLHGMLHLVRDIRYGGAQPNFDLLGAMVYYIHAFPERFHHPKEDAYLFRLVRLRHPDAAPMLDRLQEEHRTGVDKIRSMEQALGRYQQEGAVQLQAFYGAVAAYGAFHYVHARTEENELLPLAENCLTAADWAEIDAAFAGHTDPLLGVEAGTEYNELFRRIVNLAPRPLGVGPEASGNRGA